MSIVAETRKTAFRPVYENAVDPYSFDESARETPRIALDGGILLPSEVLVNEGDSALGSYLQQRTMPTGRFYAVTHSNQDGTNSFHLHSDNAGNFLTSRGPAYYETSISRIKPETEAQRRNYLLSHLQQNAALAARWDEVEASLNQYPQEVQDAIRAAIAQHFANDSIAVEYARRVAGHFNPQFLAATEETGRQILELSTDYYRTLLRQDAAYFARQPQQLMDLSALLPQVLQETQQITPDEVDDIRAFREVDATGLTLAAAQTFMNDLPHHPDVLVPLLGAYDLAPALKALGYEGAIATPLVTYQKINGTEKLKQRYPVDVRAQLPDGFAESGYAVFEDSFATGNSMIRLIEQMGSEPEAIRIMYHFPLKTSEQRMKYIAQYGHIDLQSYYTYPSSRRRGPCGKKYMLPRHISEVWAGLHSF